MNEFGCNLIIDTDNEDPKIVSKITGVEFSEILIKGDPFVNSKGQKIPQKLNDQNLWILKVARVQETDGKYLNASLEHIFSLLELNREQFEIVFSRFPKRHILCYGYYYDFHQYFILSKDLISLMNSFSIDVEFDFYFLKDENIKDLKLKNS